MLVPIAPSGATATGSGRLDLTTQQPRAGDLELGGWNWLPRMIDKARATYYGNPGTYVHPCGRDRMLLTKLGITAEEFKTVIDAGPTDDDVLRALAALRRQKGLEDAGESPSSKEGEGVL